MGIVEQLNGQLDEQLQKKGKINQNLYRNIDCANEDYKSLLLNFQKWNLLEVLSSEVSNPSEEEKKIFLCFIKSLPSFFLANWEIRQLYHNPYNLILKPDKNQGLLPRSYSEAELRERQRVFAESARPSEQLLSVLDENSDLQELKKFIETLQLFSEEQLDSHYMKSYPLILSEKEQDFVNSYLEKLDKDTQYAVKLCLVKAYFQEWELFNVLFDWKKINKNKIDRTKTFVLKKNKVEELVKLAQRDPEQFSFPSASESLIPKYKKKLLYASLVFFWAALLAGTVTNAVVRANQSKKLK